MDFFWPDIPMWLQWLIALISFVAFFMAIQPFLQMIYGKPDIHVKFAGPPTTEYKDLNSVGCCYISNKPIKDGWLYKLGISRQTAEDVIVYFSVTEIDSGRIIMPNVFPRIWIDGDTRRKRATLPASNYSSLFGVFDEKAGKIYVDKQDAAGKENLITPGKYSVLIGISYGAEARSFKRNFIVRETEPYGFWEQESH